MRMFPSLLLTDFDTRGVYPNESAALTPVEKPQFGHAAVLYGNANAKNELSRLIIFLAITQTVQLYSQVIAASPLIAAAFCLRIQFLTSKHTVRSACPCHDSNIGIVSS